MDYSKMSFDGLKQECRKRGLFVGAKESHESYRSRQVLEDRLQRNDAYIASEVGHWQISYRGETGWKNKYYHGTKDAVERRIKRLKYDKIEVKKLDEAHLVILRNCPIKPVVFQEVF